MLKSPEELKIEILKAENERLRKEQEELKRRNAELKEEVAEALRNEPEK